VEIGVHLLSVVRVTGTAPSGSSCARDVPARDGLGYFPPETSTVHPIDGQFLRANVKSSGLRVTVLVTHPSITSPSFADGEHHTSNTSLVSSSITTKISMSAAPSSSLHKHTASPSTFSGGEKNETPVGHVRSTVLRTTN
jgi:hypothetical protein